MASRPDDIFFLGQEQIGSDARLPQAEQEAANADSHAPSKQSDRGRAGSWRMSLLAALPLAAIAIVAALHGGSAGEPTVAPPASVRLPQGSTAATAPWTPRPRPGRAVSWRRREVGTRVRTETPSKISRREPSANQSANRRPSAPSPKRQHRRHRLRRRCPAAPPGPSLPLGDGPGARPEFGIER